MPYTIDSDNLPSHVKAMPLRKKKQWIAVFNSALKKNDDEGAAMKTANGVVKGKEAAQAEPEAETAEAAEMGESLEYIPPGIVSFVDLHKTEQAYETVEQVQASLFQFNQMVWNVWYSQELDTYAAKFMALQSLLDELVGEIARVVNAGGTGELAEAATVKARARSALNALSALLTDKTLPKSLVDQVESVRSALRKNWSDLEGEAHDEKDGAAASEAEAASLAESLSSIALAESEDNGPLLLDVGLIRAGWGNERDNHYYPAVMLEKSGPVFVGAKMYETDHRQNEKSTRTWVSTVQSVEGMGQDGSLVARVAVHDPNFAQRLRNLNELGSLQQMECSILADGTVNKAVYAEGGRKGRQIETITRVESVDWVTRAGAGGRAIALAENDKGVKMKPKPNEPQTEPVTENQPESEPVTVHENEPPEGAPVPVVETEPVPAKLMEAAAVASLLEKSGLPELAAKRLGTGQYADEPALAAAIAAEKEYIKAITGSGRPQSLGASAPVVEKKPDEIYREKLAEIDRRYGRA